MQHRNVIARNTIEGSLFCKSKDSQAFTMPESSQVEIEKIVPLELPKTNPRGIPRRLFSLPKSLSELQLQDIGTVESKTLRTLSDTRAQNQWEMLPDVPSDVKCVPRISSLSFKRSRRDLEEAYQNSSREEVLTRACRVRVNITAVKNLKRRMRDADTKLVALKLKVEHLARISKESSKINSQAPKRCLASFNACCSFERSVANACWSGSPEILRQEKQIRIGAVEDDASVKVNQSFTFDIKDPKGAVLSVHVVSKSRFGGEESLGICSDVHIIDLLAGNHDVKAKWYDLFSKRGKKLMPGKILMDIVAGIAEPEHRISIFLGTWNVGNARPPKDLSRWLPTNNAHELVIVGSQECDYHPRQPFSDCGKDWINSVKSCIGTKYKLVCATSRSQIRLAAFVRDDAEKAISEVDSGSEATGVGHVVANKGAVCVAFKFWDTDLCFVNSHFAAHVGYCDVRNSNYKEVVENLSIGYQGMDILSKFHHVFWMGDLNYRLDFGNAEGKTLAPQKLFWQKIVDQVNTDYKELLQHDELIKEIAASRVFYGFHEGQITFAPTFKMLRDSVSSYDEKRVPAWCDRILWRSFDECNVELTSYFSCPEINTSDHKPVGATVSLTAYALPSSNSDEDGKRWHIHFTSLQGKNLRPSDINGFSDPYVSFLGANLLHEFSSKVKHRTLNPVWDPAKDLPKLVLNATSLHRLEREYLLCHVLDYDYASANDTLGFGAIPLAGLVAAFKRNPDEVASFSIELLHRGVPAGALKGGMKLTWEKSIIKQKSLSLLVRTLTFRKSFKQAFFSKDQFQ